MQASQGIDLTCDGGVLDFVVLRQEQGLADDDGEGVISFKRQEQILGLGSRSRIGHNAQVLIVRLHQDVARAKVDFVRSLLTMNNQKAVA